MLKNGVLQKVLSAIMIPHFKTMTIKVPGLSLCITLVTWNPFCYLNGFFNAIGCVSTWSSDHLSSRPGMGCI